MKAALLFLFLFAGLFPAAGSTATNASDPRPRWHRIKVEPWPNTPKIRTLQKFNPIWWFKNIDDPHPPDSYRPHDKLREMKWDFRNPFHNFDFYVIGIADKTFVRSGRYPEHMSNPHGGWNFSVARYKVLFLPGIAYTRGKFDFYFGWRKRGNFGIKINFTDRKPRADQPDASPSVPSPRTKPGD